MSRQGTLDLVETLDPLRFPLHGSRLIEASAGTGKTYTIAALYVRLVLGHGGDHAYARALTPPEILVVTFTDAATQELRDRIRRRLAQAAGAFQAGPEEAPDDPLLHALRADYPADEWPACARKLQLAAEWMDEAAVSTIHGWCNRMLREHAFDSDSLFSQTLVTDASALLAECVRDYWRSFMAPLEARAVAEVQPWWPGPAALQRSVKNLVGQAGLPDATREPAELLRSARAERVRRLAELKAPWPAWADAVEQILDDAVAGKRVDGRRLQARYYRPWLATLRNWAADPLAPAPDLKGGWTRLSPDGLREAWKDGEPPAHPAFDAIGELPAQLAALPQARNDLLCHAARWVARRLAQEQQRRAQLGFDDLLTRLAAALDGANGERLAQRMRAQFPVALIDEFQDTDPVQYRIFDAVYRAAEADGERARERALILIGDPKQAIYGFRGADIYTYLAARHACAGRLYTLHRNFRSTHDMVAATNRCFAAAEVRSDGEGAFLFRGAAGNPLPFRPADAQGRSDAFIVDGQAQPALTLWWLGAEGSEAVEEGRGSKADAPSKGAYIERMAQICASRMTELLARAQRGAAGFAAPGRPGEVRTLRPADMAVLVNNRTEADAIRGALAARGLRSVYLSDKESVFACAPAGDLQLWLAACAEPEDARALRAALASATLGLSYAELDALNHDELAWEARVLQFRGNRERWRRQGVLPMLRRLLGDFGVPARLLGESTVAGRAVGAESGERVLTDLLHLAELLQRASGVLDGEHALIRYLAEQRQGGGNGGGGGQDDPAARQIRLESDADRVQVVTVHKSKGLEYPLVFLPFACASRPVKADDVPLKYHDDGGQAHLALAADAAIVARADRERLGEDLRKLYVALTRARYATWIGVAALEGSAVGHLLGGTPSPAALEAWRGACAQIALELAPASSEARLAVRSPLLDEAATGPAKVAREARRAVADNWWVASYSALLGAHGAVVDGRAAGGPASAATAGAARASGVDSAELGETAERADVNEVAEVADTAAQDQFGEARAAPVVDDDAPTTPHSGAGLPHDLPRGADVGSFLHGLLEAAARRGFARLDAAADGARAIHELVEQRCRLRGWQRYAAALGAWLARLLTAPLALPESLGFVAPPLRLGGLRTAIAEMEFWMCTRAVDVAAVDRRVCAHTLGGAARPALRPAQLNGMLKGFIDLVFEHDGRYYVADYKSNWLGASDAAYTAEALRAAMLQARYDLQYALYLVALHRLLRSRLPDYDYERHVGGAVYLFLRATPGSGHGVFADRPPRALIEALDRLFAGDVPEIVE
jgi:exodeoxyribonuclease V beta subunit